MQYDTLYPGEGGEGGGGDTIAWDGVSQQESEQDRMKLDGMGRDITGQDRQLTECYEAEPWIENYGTG